MGEVESVIEAFGWTPGAAIANLDALISYHYDVRLYKDRGGNFLLLYNGEICNVCVDKRSDNGPYRAFVYI